MIDVEAVAVTAARNITVTRRVGDSGTEWFTVEYDYACSCGRFHRGKEIRTRPIRFVGLVRVCGSTRVVFDYTDARFIDG